MLNILFNILDKTLNKVICGFACYQQFRIRTLTEPEGKKSTL